MHNPITLFCPCNTHILSPVIILVLAGTTIFTNIITNLSFWCNNNMKMDDSNWFARWEEELPSPEELISLSQTLITPDLAVAFDIGNTRKTPPPTTLPPPPISQLLQPQANNTVSSQVNSSAEFESPELGGGGGGGDDQARTLKRPRLVWTPQLHKRFVDAVAHLGIKNAVPKTIMQLMSVDGLTRENVASHLQKYRLYLKRMQGMNNGGAGNGNNSPSGVDSASDHLFASSPVPPDFLRPNSEHYMPYVPTTGVARMQHHHPQMAVQGLGHVQQPLLPQQFRHFGNSSPSGQFDHPFLGRQQVHRIGTQNHNVGNSVMPSDVESPKASERKVLTLFPAGEDC